MIATLTITLTCRGVETPPCGWLHVPAAQRAPALQGRDTHRKLQHPEIRKFGEHDVVCQPVENAASNGPWSRGNA